MRTLAFLLGFLCLSPTLPAQALDWNWATHLGGPELERGHDIAMDKAGNLYVSGYFKDSLLLNGNYLVGKGKEDIFVAKLDSSDGHPLWIQAFGDTSLDFGLGLACDPQGNCYVSGILSGPGTVDFGGVPLSIGTAFSKMFLARLDSSGQVTWAKTFGGSGLSDNAIFRDIEVDPQGNVYVTGYFAGSVLFDDTTVSTNGIGDQNNFLIKFTPAGNRVWLITSGGTSLDQAYAIQLDGKGKLYQTGIFRENPTFGAFTLNGQGSDDVFVAQYDTAGQVLWASQIAGPDIEQGREIAVDFDGSCYITGTFQGTTSFGTTSLTSNARDAFLCKLDSAGNPLWVQVQGGPGNETGWGIACDGNGNVFTSVQYATGASLQSTVLPHQGAADVLMAQYDGQGNLVNYRLVNGSNVDVGYRIHLDGRTRGYLVGGFAFTGTFGTKVLTAVGVQDAFVAQFTHINTTSVRPGRSLPSLLVFPNPNQGRFRVELPERGKRIQVFNALGQLILDQETKGRSQEVKIDQAGWKWLQVIDQNGKILAGQKVWIQG